MSEQVLINAVTVQVDLGGANFTGNPDLPEFAFCNELNCLLFSQMPCFCTIITCATRGRSHATGLCSLQGGH